MFTPPPSPRPIPQIIITSDDDTPEEKGKKLAGLPPSAMPYRDEEGLELTFETYAEKQSWKQTTARRIRWTILLVPAVLVLVALTSRQLASRPAIIEHVEEHWSSTVHERRHVHKRVPQVLSLTDPAAPSESSILTTSEATSSGSQTSQAPTGTTTISQTQQTIPPVPNNPVLPTPFPQPFDTTFSNANLTLQSCSDALTNMTQSTAFRSCRPLSLLEQFSNAFIQAQTNLSNLNTLIWGTCNTATSFDQCTANLDWFAGQLTSACPDEIADGNTMVESTILALKAYPVVRSAGCLINQQSSSYCYEEAVHAQSPYDLYLYSLPVGTGMPNSSTPSCSSCSGNLYGLYAEALQTNNDSATGLKSTYDSAASAAVSACGSGFAALNVASSAVETRWLSGGSKALMLLTFALGTLLL